MSHTWTLPSPSSQHALQQHSYTDGAAGAADVGGKRVTGNTKMVQTICVVSTHHVNVS